MVLRMLDLIILGDGPAAATALTEASARGLVAARPPGPVWSVIPGFRIDALAPAGSVALHAANILVVAGRRDLPSGGAVPEWDVPRLLRAAMRFDCSRDVWMPVRDATARTSVPGLLAIETEGEARAALDTVMTRVVPALDSRLQAGASATAWVPGTSPGMTGCSEVCPCEGVTAAAIEAAVRDGARDMNQLRSFTRCGMGACQGRLCEEAAARVLAPFVGGRAAAGQWTMRPPLIPIPLDVLVGAFTYADIPVPPPAPL